ncbi:MAG: hypothetical protein HZA95_03040 [Candidatus Vogelbacteria bacterium]|nr:hypothetical protein [Candidatus Vogelbacteria bacterium]
MLQDVPEGHKRTIVLVAIATFIIGGLLGYTLGLKQGSAGQVSQLEFESTSPASDTSGAVDVEVYKNPFEESANPFR